MASDSDNTKPAFDEQTERGVHNPRVVDLIAFDAARDEVLLTMLEQRKWNGGAEQLVQLQEKLNNYLDYVLDGYLTKQYPEYSGKQVRIVLECVEPPAEGDASELIDAITRYLTSIRIGFDVIISS